MTEQWIYNGVEFKVGDRVKVVSDAVTNDPNGMGAGVEWNNCWVHATNEDGYLQMGMDGFISMEFEIHDIDEHGVYFSEESYGFPLSCMINLSQRESLPVIQQKEAA